MDTGRGDRGDSLRFNRLGGTAYPAAAGPGPGRHRPCRATGRQLLRLRQRQLDENRHHPGGPFQHRYLPQGVSAGGEGHRRADPPRRRRPSGPRQQRRQDRRLLRGLDGHRGDRAARPHPAAAAAAADRRDRHAPGSGPRAGRRPARRRRPDQRHPLPHAEPVRPVRDAGAGRPLAQHCLPSAGRPRHAQPRLLPVDRPAHGGGAREVPHLRHRLAEAGRHRRRRRRGEDHPRAGNEDRPRAGKPGREPGHPQGEQPVAHGRLRAEGAGAGLGDLLQGRRPRRPGADRRVATQRHHRSVRAGGKRAAGRVEGPAHLPCPQRRRAAAAQGLRRAQLRLLRPHPAGHAAAAAALEAGGGRHQRRPR